MVKVSLCMIAKDEGHFLAASLTSVRDFVDEIILVDTGSTDTTKEIAKHFQAKIFDFPWKEDFAAARNFSLDKASGDWIFVLDADEILAKRDAEKIRDLAERAHADVWGFKVEQRNYTYDKHTADLHVNTGAYERQEGDFLGYTLAKPVRLFRNIPDIRYQYKVHEAVEPTILAAKKNVEESGLAIHHYREKRDQREQEKKRDAYMRMAEAMVAEHPQDPKPYYDLALIYKAKGRYNRALEMFQKSIAQDPIYRNPFSNIAEIHLRLKEIPQAIEHLKKGIQTKPNANDCYNLALLYSKGGKHKEAVDSLRQAIDLDPGNVGFYLTLSSIYIAHQQPEKAMKLMEICTKQNPKNQEAWNFLGIFYFQNQELDKAIHSFEQGIAIHPKIKNEANIKLHVNLAKSLNAKGEYKKTITILENLLKLDPLDPELIKKRIAELNAKQKKEGTPASAS